jgi:four helix bundle protein
LIKSYQDLEVWQKAMNWVVTSYGLSKLFPKTEVYGLASQLQRAAVSIPANIAEGHQRRHSREYLQHLSIAYGSLAELQTHIFIAKRLKYIDEKQVDQILEKTSKNWKNAQWPQTFNREKTINAASGPRPPVPDPMRAREPDQAFN